MMRPLLDVIWILLSFAILIIYLISEALDVLKLHALSDAVCLLGDYILELTTTNQ